MADGITSLIDANKLKELVNNVIIDDTDNGVFRVNRKAFVDQAIFELERKMIFDHCWLYLGHVSEVAKPSSFVTRKIAGRRIIMNRDRAGKLHAFYNTCSHRGAVLCREKSGSRGSFACPYHGWLYDDAGKLINIPGKESYSPAVSGDASLGLVEVPQMSEFCGLVFICFDPKAPSLEDYLAGAGKIIELITAQGEHGMEVCGGVQEYSTAANWKLLLENSADGYHAAPTHVTYFDYVEARDAQYLTKLNEKRNLDALVGVPSLNVGMRSLGNGHSVIETEGVWGRPCARWVPGWGEDARAEIEEIGRRIVAKYGADLGREITSVDRNTLIFPNLVVNDLMAITIRTFYPVRPDYMEISAWCLAPIGEKEESRGRRLQNFVEFFGPAGFASPDDVEMLDLCQQGYSNHDFLVWNDISKGMPKQKPAADDEEQMRVFWRQWRERMTANV
jgi:p-cumate 2,3-dioxygenase subunit alpha